MLNLLPLDAVSSWGWRVPFLFGAVVGAVGFILRRRLSSDRPAASEGFPLVVAVRRHYGQILQAIGLSLVNAVPFYISFVFIVPWLRQHADLSARGALVINSINMAIMLLVIPTAAWVSDRVGRKPVLVAASAGLVLLTWPLFGLMQVGEIWAVFLGQFGIALMIGSYAAVSPVAICELFPRAVRCSAVSASYNISVGLAGGTAPMMAAWLIAESGYALSPALYATLAAALSLLAALSLRSGYSAITADHLSVEPAVVRT